MTLAEAVAAALDAGARIEDAHTHPMKLWWEGLALTHEVIVELVAADPVALDKVLSWWVGLWEFWSTTAAPWPKVTSGTRRGGASGYSRTTSTRGRFRMIRRLAT
jgi:hypothetical protein